MSDALIAPTYGEVVELRRHFKLLYSTQALDYLLATPTPTAAQLTAWLATPANLDAYQRLVGTHAGAGVVCASSAVMGAVAGSAVALEALRDCGPGRAALADSQTAMNAVLAAGADAIGRVFAIAAVRAAVYDSEVAWAAVVASPNGKAEIDRIAIENTLVGNVHRYPVGVSVSTRAVLVSQKAAQMTSHAGALVDTYSTTSTTFIDRYVRVTGLTHRNASATYSSIIRYVVMQ